MDSCNSSPSQHHQPSSKHSPKTSGPLKIPPLPRFHPANFPSQYTSTGRTAPTVQNSPQRALSPYPQQRQYPEEQRQLYFYQQMLLNGGMADGKSCTGAMPDGPRLVPNRSPGPVIPLELEGQGAGDEMAGSTSNPAAHRELVQKLSKEAAKSRGA